MTRLSVETSRLARAARNGRHGRGSRGIRLRNVHGWFTRIERGLYELTPEGALALLDGHQALMPQELLVVRRYTGQLPALVCDGLTSIVARIEALASSYGRPL